MLQRILEPVRFMYICGSFHLLLPATAVIFFYDRRTHRFACFQWRMPWYAMPSSQFLTWSGFVCTCLQIHTYTYLIITRIWLHNIFFLCVILRAYSYITSRQYSCYTNGCTASSLHPPVRCRCAWILPMHMAWDQTPHFSRTTSGYLLSHTTPQRKQTLHLFAYMYMRTNKLDFSKVALRPSNSKHGLPSCLRRMWVWGRQGVPEKRIHTNQHQNLWCAASSIDPGRCTLT